MNSQGTPHAGSGRQWDVWVWCSHLCVRWCLKPQDLRRPLWARMYTHERGKGSTLAIPTFQEMAQRRGQQKTIKWRGWWRASRGRLWGQGSRKPEWAGSGPPQQDSGSECRSVVSDSLWPHGLYSPWNSPGQNIGVDMQSMKHESKPSSSKLWNLG